MHSILFVNTTGQSLSDGKILVVNAFDSVFLAHSNLKYSSKNSDVLVSLNTTKDVVGQFSNSFTFQSAESSGHKKEDGWSLHRLN